MPAMKKLGVTLLAGAVGLVAFGSAKADTITVLDSFHNSVAGEYQYLITFDGESYVQGGDGFALYDWAGLVNTNGANVASGTAPYSLAVDPSNSPYFQKLSGPVANPFTHFAVSQQLIGNGLTDSGGSTTASAVADSSAKQAASDNGLAFDNSGVENLTFSWTDGTYDAAGGAGSATAILTLFSTVTPSSAPTVYGSADRSGTSPGTSYGHAAASILAPNFAPLPSAWMGALALFGLIGIRQARRYRSA